MSGALVLTCGLFSLFPFKRRYFCHEYENTNSNQWHKMTTCRVPVFHSRNIIYIYIIYTYCALIWPDLTYAPWATLHPLVIRVLIAFKSYLTSGPKANCSSANSAVLVVRTCLETVRNSKFWQVVLRANRTLTGMGDSKRDNHGSEISPTWICKTWYIISREFLCWVLKV